LREPTQLHTSGRSYSEREREYLSTLYEAGRRLALVGVEAIVIKSGLEARALGAEMELAGAGYGDIDLVVGEDGWNHALLALEEWGRVEGCGWLEPNKRMLRLEHGPDVHLHRDAEWFGVVAISARDLRRLSAPWQAGLLLPVREAALCVLLGHAVFQNLSFDLPDLLEVDWLADERTCATAERLTRNWGWGRAFAAALDVARSELRRVRSGQRPRLPVRLPISRSLRDGCTHAAYLASSGDRRAAIRELILRPALVTAKQRRRLLR
jgi:hypothetical protein